MDVMSILLTLWLVSKCGITSSLWSNDKPSTLSCPLTYSLIGFDTSYTQLMKERNFCIFSRNKHNKCQVPG